MSHNDYITNLLDLKDKNININDTLSTKTIKDVTYKVINATLSYDVDCCPICGTANDNSIIKYGSKASDIKILPIAGNPTILRLHKQRFYCKSCDSTFSAKSHIVEKNCFISNSVKDKITVDLTKKISEKDIAEINNVSHSTVSKIVDNAFYQLKPNKNYLPEHLLFDEFKSTNDADGAMSFIFCDADKHEIVDFVENRQLRKLIQYFQSYSKKARRSVKTICIDFYTPYIKLIKTMFPNAKIIADRFHIVQLLTRSMSITRVKFMKKLDKNSLEYKRLKKYWKLIQKDYNDLDSVHFYHYAHFRELVSQKTVVDTCISIDLIFAKTHKVYQLLLSDIKRKDDELLFKHIKLYLNEVNEQMRTSMKTILDKQNYVTNALNSRYSNGIIEGINNYIKVLKRIAFGYKSFYHFRNRILNYKKTDYEKRETQSSLSTALNLSIDF